MKKHIKNCLYFLFLMLIGIIFIYGISSLSEVHEESVKFKKITYKNTEDLLGYQLLEFKLGNDCMLRPIFRIKGRVDATPKAWSEPPSKIIVKPKPEMEEPRLEGKDLYISYLKEICETYYPNVDPYIGLAVMDTETGGTYNPTLESKCGAAGLMQVIPKYHARRVEKYGLSDIWDPYTNIIAGIDLLSELYDSEGNWEDALYGYNHSRKYVRYVIAKAEDFRKDDILG